jgi:hypothetical protein
MPIPPRAREGNTLTGEDTAKYLVNPGTVKSPGRHSAGNLRHARPYLANGSKFFVWPIGVEGFTRRGEALLGLHRYIGGNASDGVTINHEEARIELTGTFPGITAQANMVNCINMLRSKTPERGLILYAPGVFNREQYVLPESWEFDHPEEDRTHSITYRITLARIGEGAKVRDPHGTAPPPNPSVKKIKPKGKPSRIYVINDGIRTLRMVANEVYGNQNSWQELVKKNQTAISKWRKTHQNLPNHRLPTFRWPVGTKFHY